MCVITQSVPDTIKFSIRLAVDSKSLCNIILAVIRYNKRGALALNVRQRLLLPNCGRHTEEIHLKHS